jgi:hypothetical protein
MPTLLRYYIAEQLQQRLRSQTSSDAWPAGLQIAARRRIVEAALRREVQQMSCDQHQASMQLGWCETRITHTGDVQTHLAHCAYAQCTHSGTEHKCRWLYDGQDDDMFNFSGSEMFTHHFMAHMADQLFFALLCWCHLQLMPAAKAGPRGACGWLAGWLAGCTWYSLAEQASAAVLAFA